MFGEGGAGGVGIGPDAHRAARNRGPVGERGRLGAIRCGDGDVCWDQGPGGVGGLFTFRDQDRSGGAIRETV